MERLVVRVWHGPGISYLMKRDDPEFLHSTSNAREGIDNVRRVGQLSSRARAHQVSVYVELPAPAIIVEPPETR